jgi:hypothetical protein
MILLFDLSKNKRNVLQYLPKAYYCERGNIFFYFFSADGKRKRKKRKRKKKNRLAIQRNCHDFSMPCEQKAVPVFPLKRDIAQLLLFFRASPVHMHARQTRLYIQCVISISIRDEKAFLLKK